MTESLVEHWSSGHTGMCQAEECHGEIETVEHILFICKAYTQSRRKAILMWLHKENEEAYRMVLYALSKGCNSKNVSFAKYCLFFRSLITYGGIKGCFQKSLTNLSFKMSLILLLAIMYLKIVEWQ